ncbi:P1 family peptidase [uncultured Ruegeria sp.]|uniref:P1 family peptidase n=1 Tax=uncultured Ruegeria sp. TaxID=259304 RepID=UPI002615D60C|nr:P1 family peptidase [uncultured Ruegeria sp.]
MPSAIRIRDLGVAPGFLPPGVNNAITDVPGVSVGHITLKDGGICTGATAILHCPPDDLWLKARFGGSHVLNGYGQVIGRDWLQESGLVNGPILLTSYFGVGALVQGLNAICPDTAAHGYTHHVVGETWDGWLSDPMSGAILPEHAAQVIQAAKRGPVEEGCVGGGTGMCTYDFKSGIGTSSRQIEVAGQAYTLGVLAQSNFGDRRNLVVDGIHLGREISHKMVPIPERKRVLPGEDGSIVIIIATDAPLLPQQCNALSRRAVLGLGRTGAMANSGSGDFAIAFSTGNIIDVLSEEPSVGISSIPARKMDPLFHAAVEATEEAILNSLCTAETTTGFEGRTVYALPHDHILNAVAKRQN